MPEKQHWKGRAGPARGQGASTQAGEFHSPSKSAHPLRAARCPLDQTGDRHRPLAGAPGPRTLGRGEKAVRTKARLGARQRLERPAHNSRNARP